VVDDLFKMVDDTTAMVSVHAQPGAGRSEVVGRHGTAIKIRVAAPPEDGRANDAILKVLADGFGLAPSAVEVAQGTSSRTKAFRIAGVDATMVRTVLERLLGEGGDARGASRRGRR